MIPLGFRPYKERGLKILCLGAHCDDIEIGCGASLLHIQRQYDVQSIQWIVIASNPTRKKEALDGAEHFIVKAENTEVTILDFKDAFLNSFALEIKEYFETLKPFAPDIIFTHTREDRHQDHKLLSDLTWNTFRDHLILEYEIPKYDGDLGKPNCYVPISDEDAEFKAKTIYESYKTQQKKHWFEEETFLSHMRMRGMEANGQSRYAEAFHVRKWNL